MPGLSMNLREQIAELLEQTADTKEKSTEDISRERGVEIQLRMAAQLGFTEDATDPTVAPQDYDIRQSGRVPQLQNSDLWLRPTDLSWHFPILMTIREEPFKNNRSRTSEKWKAKFEEAKRQKIKENDDGRRELLHDYGSVGCQKAVVLGPSACFPRWTGG